MPRDLFITTVDHKYAPKRSKWTIAGSILIHTLLLGAILVVPIMSALDNYVVLADKIEWVPPPNVMPAVPAPPPKTATPVPAAVNPNAAPPLPPENPVTEERPVTGYSGPPIPGALPSMGTNVGVLGAPNSNASAITDFRQPENKKPEPVRPGGNIKVPARTYYVEPIYPTLALAVKKEGTVILEAMIDESGAVRGLKVLRSEPLLDKAALEAVAKWRYSPTLLNGVAVPIVMTVTVTFALR